MSDAAEQILNLKNALRMKGFRKAADTAQTAYDIVMTCGAELTPIYEGLAELAVINIPEGPAREAEKQVKKVDYLINIVFALANAEAG